MGKLSRHMPPPGTATLTTEGLLGCCAAAAFVGAAVLDAEPRLIPPVAAVVALLVVATIREERRLARLAAGRRGESICTFARSFPRRSVDPWVLRAVYEELGRALGSSPPPRPADRFGEDYRMLDEDVEDLIVDVAARAGRSLGAAEAKPHDAGLETVGDVVRFLSAQPPSPAGLALRPYLRGSS